MSRDSRIVLLDREETTTRIDGLSMRAQSQMLGLNRSGLYYRPLPPSEEELRLKRRIDEIYTARPFYGIRRITVALQQEGLNVNHKAVARHMREMGLCAIVPGPHLSRRAHRASDSIYPYLLKGVMASYPNHVWGVDITYVRMTGGYPGWLYLVAVLDWYSRYIVSWELSQGLGQSFVMEAARAALLTATPTIWNSDQGSHFTSPQYTSLLTQEGVQISMDGRGRFVDNIFTERLWRTIKYEEVYLHEYSTPKQARQSLSQYINFYNQERPHQALDYRTPAAIYRQIATSTQTQTTKGGDLTLESGFSWS
jgi:putative transposase